MSVSWQNRRLTRTGCLKTSMQKQLVRVQIVPLETRVYTGTGTGTRVNVHAAL